MLLDKAKRIVIAVKNNPFLSHVRNKAAYEGEGKTTVRVLNQDTELGLMIDSYATYGFRLNNGITVLGPMAIFPRTVLSWQVRGSHEITEDSLRLFKLLEPKIDLLILGVETKERESLNTVYRAARAAACNVELLPVEHACSTFNFLNAEGRSVAGALVPPLSIDPSPDDMLRSRLHYQNLYQQQLT
ncbi:NADH dehydrogenase [ubiquinone] 1 alpha subcomplex assembly factor 3 [Galleria mellonella]|uniref:NADH dehydrogenase [ubiquinone] 1 alpha subcomplex assembly factor 3 n=1 Tax=Galleria mellonella TaxID=7137 RepID=A0A6J1WIS7_GALME|nr:NADH dehydrogenase [ubiquinone] 1 alpha subcomplex assembly factor 3 [Galleria mellonella]